MQCNHTQSEEVPDEGLRGKGTKENLPAEEGRMFYEQRLGSIRTKAGMETGCARHSDVMGRNGAPN